jgi:phosphoribosylformylglycinamidine (FGAM) synthase-like enzyme
MAKKATKGAAAPKKTKATAVAEVMELISEKNFKTLVRKVMAAKKIMSEERGSLGGIIADACEHQHLHKGAFGIYCRIDAMSARKRSALLFALDAMREMSDWDDQLDLFVAKAAEEPQPELPKDEVGEARQRREATSAGAGVAVPA